MDPKVFFSGSARRSSSPPAAVPGTHWAPPAALQAAPSGGALYNAVVGQTVAGARQAFDALSGEVHASAVSAAFDDARLPREAVLDRLANPYAPPQAPPPSGFFPTPPPLPPHPSPLLPTC